MDKYRTEAAAIADAIRHFNESPAALENFESYLAYHFPAWLEKCASTPAGMVFEFNMFSRMYDKEAE